MIIGFTGSQKGMTANQFDRLVTLLKDLNPTIAHHGDCIGADDVFHEICLELNIAVVIHPPIENSKRAFCKGSDEILPTKQYLARNRDIVNISDELIAVPGEKTEQLRSGTWATYRYAKKIGKTTHLITP